MSGVIRSEFLKVFTTKVWWGMLIGLGAYLALALWVNVSVADADDGELLADGAWHAGNIYTSGQYFGVLFAAVLGALLSTNEHRHQTLTSTFLVTPRRGRVLGAKLIVALTWGAIYAVATMVISVIIGAIFLRNIAGSTHLTDPEVLRVILLNVIAYGVWGVIGFGVGSLFRSQVGPIILLIVGYLATNQFAQIVLFILAEAFDRNSIADLYWYLPYGATSVMTVGLPVEIGAGDAPDWWVGLLTLLGYGTAAGAIGTSLTMSRDVG